MKPFVLLNILIISLMHFSSAQHELFEKHVFTTDHFKLPYRFYQPSIQESGKLYPLVLYLHGAGERGNDNELPLKNGVMNLVTPDRMVNYPCFILIPQCPVQYRWVDVDWSLKSHSMPEEISISLFHAMSLMKKIISQYPVDTARLYVTGLSMGGFGTWDLICRYPDVFAAAVPVCGGGDTTLASRLTSVPVWAFHGQKDKIVLPERSADMVNAINDKGGNARLTLYSTVAHNAWIMAYQDETMYRWLFSQTKQRIFYEDE
jgi:predicted peptidase